MSAEPLLRVRDLTRHFPIRRGLLRRQVGVVRAVDGVSFDIHAGETLGLVGESGCGKSTAGRSILQLLRPTSGSVHFDGEELTTATATAMRARRRDLQMVFQDPYASLNPRMSVAAIVREPLEIHRIGSDAERRARVGELLGRVGLEADLGSRYPHQLSGGQRQRVGIARALATAPRFIVADEPISALDVSVQAQVVNLMRDLGDELGLTYLFIAHDLSMVRYLSDRVAVMYLGRIVEIAGAAALFDRPLHPYTQALMAAAPVADPRARRRTSAELVPGEPPSAVAPPAGCRFHPRCPFATERCRTEAPSLRAPCEHAPSRQVACHHAEQFIDGAPSSDTERT